MHDSHAKAIWNSVLARRYDKGINVEIDLPWVRQRLSGVWYCELTGWSLDLGPRRPGGSGKNPYAASFDRINNDLGYVPTNIRVVCAFVNFMMNAYSDEDMAPIIRALQDAAYD